MGREQRNRKIRQVNSYKPGHPGEETEYTFIPHIRNIKIGDKTITRNTTTRRCDGKRALYQQMKQVDKARNK